MDQSVSNIENQTVRVHGNSRSPYHWRVIWTLKHKGISHEVIEEDLSNKSDVLLKINPVYKKILVLVHGGKPICESMQIVEYIDEVWPQNPLLPMDPYERALVRFWVKYADDKLHLLWKLAQVKEQEKEKAASDCLEFLQKIEEQGLKEDMKYFGGENIGIVDIAFAPIAHWFVVLDSKLNFNLFDPQKFPLLHAWTIRFKALPLIKHNLPPIVRR